MQNFKLLNKKFKTSFYKTIIKLFKSGKIKEILTYDLHVDTLPDFGQIMHHNLLKVFTKMEQ